MNKELDLLQLHFNFNKIHTKANWVLIFLKYECIEWQNAFLHFFVSGSLATKKFFQKFVAEQTRVYFKISFQMYDN